MTTALIGVVSLLAGCGGSAGDHQYSDVYGYRCSIAAAYPTGYCPADHGLRITTFVWMWDRTGHGCKFDTVDVRTGLCPR